MIKLSIYSVGRIAIKADSAVGDSGVIRWQRLEFFDRLGSRLGEVVLFLDRAEVALPLGDQPPYWGVDGVKPLDMVDGESPF